MFILKAFAENIFTGQVFTENTFTGQAFTENIFSGQLQKLGLSSSLFVERERCSVSIFRKYFTVH